MAPYTSSSEIKNSKQNEKSDYILASAYCIDSCARLRGFHYSTTSAGGKLFHYCDILVFELIDDHHLGAQWYS